MTRVLGKHFERLFLEYFHIQFAQITNFLTYSPMSNTEQISIGSMTYLICFLLGGSLRGHILALTFSNKKKKKPEKNLSHKSDPFL